MSEKLIRLSNLSMTFEDGETILDGINLYINNKELNERSIRSSSDTRCFPIWTYMTTSRLG